MHPENQELLWNIMNQTPYLTSMLSYQTTEQKQVWFKNIIQTFYQQNSHKTLDKAQLNQLNKDTLSYMVNIVKGAPPPNGAESAYLQQRNQRTVDTFQPKIETPEIIPDNRANIFNQQFSARQKEYETMLDKKPPLEPDFKEPLSDGAISNMDELIKRHLEERDAQLKQYAPKPPVPVAVSVSVPGPVPGPVTVPLTASTLTESIPGNIPVAAQVKEPRQQLAGQAAPNITLDPVEDPAQEFTQKKEDVVDSKIQALSDQITTLVDEIKVLHKKVNILLNYNALLYKDLSQNTPLVWADISGQDYELGC